MFHPVLQRTCWSSIEWNDYFSIRKSPLSLLVFPLQWSDQHASNRGDRSTLVHQKSSAFIDLTLECIEDRSCQYLILAWRSNVNKRRTSHSGWMRDYLFWKWSTPRLISLSRLACNSELFTRLTQSKCAKYIRTLRELNVAFLPYERQVRTAWTVANQGWRWLLLGVYSGLTGHVLHRLQFSNSPSTSCASRYDCRTNRYSVCYFGRIPHDSLSRVSRWLAVESALFTFIIIVERARKCWNSLMPCNKS